MSGFYGGRDGHSFIISQSFTSVAQMANSFKKGLEYTTVKFDEYVIINSENRTNPENGMIFRRGYDWDTNKTIASYTLSTDDTTKRSYWTPGAIPSGGAIYAGTIAGPNGHMPYLDFTSYEDANFNSIPEVTRDDLNISMQYLDSIIVKMNEKYPNGFKNKHDLVYVNLLNNAQEVVEKVYLYRDSFFNNYNFTYETSSTTDGTSAASYNEGWRPILNPISRDVESTGVDYVPTKGEEDEWIDNIQWTWTLLNDENNTKSVYKIGFKIPYGVHEYTAKSVNPYYNRSNNTANFENLNLINSVEDAETAEHPLYKKWQINIPKGIKGESFRNLRVTTSKIESQAITGYDTEDDRKIYVVDYYNYDSKANPTKEIIYLGDYNQIENIEFGTDGSLTIDYTHEDADTYNQFITWLTSFTLSDKGALNITFNNNKINPISKTLKWIDKVQFNDGDNQDQKIVITYNTGTTVSSVPINIVKEMQIDENRHLQVHYSDPNKGWQDLGDLSFIASGADEPATLNIGGYWLITKEVD